MYANLRKLIIAVKKPDIFIYEYIYIPSGSDPYVEKSIQHDVIKFVSDWQYKMNNPEKPVT
jgi:hypothetical protein